MFLTSALSCQGLVNKDLSQKISIINSLNGKPVPGSTHFLRGVLELCNRLVRFGVFIGTTILIGMRSLYQDFYVGIVVEYLKYLLFF